MPWPTVRGEKRTERDEPNWHVVTAPLSCRRPYYALEAVKRYPGRFAVVGMDEGQHRPCLNPSFSLPAGTSRAPDTKVRESRPARSQPLFVTADYTRCLRTPGRATSPSTSAPGLADRTFQKVADAEVGNDRGGQRA
jgi:hypothetical protein